MQNIIGDKRKMVMGGIVGVVIVVVSLLFLGGRPNTQQTSSRDLTKEISGASTANTSMSLVITALTNKKVSSTATARYLEDGGLIDARGMETWDIAPFLAKKWNLQAVNIGVDSAKIATTLQVGGLVVTAGKGAKPFTENGNFLVIRALTKEGNFKVGDPIHSDTADTEWDPQQILASMEDMDGSVYAITR